MSYLYHLDDLLLDYYPQVVDGAQEHDEWTPMAITALVTFLHDTGRLSPRSDQVEVLTAHIASITDAFLAAMAAADDVG